ncbi:hypothetical protein TIFTF001_002183 [Ficus carica]|uniref:Rx N-terminal domain-containing protein n=1 Tax=Ficus carica TaxID=3494 RepID=A0AA88CSU2_FICCA|nr:hypothetical protein TIFTF001_002183 [Ficus carica]
MQKNMVELVFGIAKEVVEKLASIAYREISLGNSIESDLKKLERTVSAIKAALEDAGEKQPLNRELDTWLTQLEDVFHDAENLLDEVECQVVRRQVVKMHAKIGRKVRRFFSRSNPLVFRISVGHKIKEIGVRLDEIAANKAKFHLAEKPERNDHVMMHGRRLQKTHSFVRASEIVVNGVGPLSSSLINECIVKFKHLRMLNLSNSSFEILPSNISRMKHLRHIDLSRNYKIKKLPNSICKLQRLQTLRLENCKELLELPRDMKCLIQLRFLSITTTQRRFSKNGIECLASLRTLFIGHCKNLVVLPHNMRRLTALETLVIGDCENLILTEEDDNNHRKTKLSLRTVVFGLLPKMMALPNWLRGCETSLQYLCIEDCPNLTALPQWLPNATSLAKLEIHKCQGTSIATRGTASTRLSKRIEDVRMSKIGGICFSSG